MEAQALMRDMNGRRRTPVESVNTSANTCTITGTLHYVGSHETGWSANEALFLTSPNTSLVGECL